MSNKTTRLLTLLLLFLLFSSSVQGKYVVKFGIYVKHLAIKKSNFVFDADFYWWMKLPLNQPGLDTSNPLKNIEFVNADLIDVRTFEKKIIGNEFYVHGSAKGEFLYVANYRNYPFDSQNLNITIESTTDEKGKCIMVADSMAYIQHNKLDIYRLIHKGIFLEGISIKDININNEDGYYNSNFGDPNSSLQSVYSRLSFNFEVERQYFSYFLKLIIPLFIIVILSYLVFFVPSSELEVASSLTVTSLIAAVAFQITIADDIPTVGYTTSCDLIFYLSYATIMIAMIQTIYTYNLEKSNKQELSKKIEKLGRWFLPIFYLLILLIIVVISSHQ